MEEFFSDRLFTALERNEPTAGMVLVAAPGMLSDEFARSVVLIVEHNNQLTFGVNLASRSDVAVFNVMPEWVPYVAKPQALYIGGPLNQQSVVGLGVTKPGVTIENHKQFQRLANRIEDLVEGIRLFAGYAEWGPGQLESEIERGDWYVAPALVSDIIAGGSVDVWGDVMRRQPMPLPLFSTFPADISDN